MKTYSKTIAMLAAAGAMALAACQQPLSTEMDGYTGKPIAVSATTDENAETRTALNGRQTEWVAGDKIGVFSPQAEGVNVAFTAKSDAANSPFDGRMIWGSGAHSFYAYYPYAEGSFDSSAVPVSVPASQIQSEGDNGEHLAALDMMVARPLVGVAAGGEVDLRFGHLFSLLEFRVTGIGTVSKIEITAPTSTRLAFDGATIDLSQNTPEAGVPYAIDYAGGAGGPSVSLTLSTPATLSEDETATPALYMMVNPADLSGKQFKVTVTVNDRPLTITADGFALERGRKYTLVVDPYKGLTPGDDVLRMIRDPYFLAYCKNAMVNYTANNYQAPWDINGDGKLSIAEAGKVEYIDVSNPWDYQGSDKISSLKGIEYFTGLVVLACESNNITSIDTSKLRNLRELVCGNNKITSLDTSKNTLLAYYICYGNQITSLDVSRNVDLMQLSAGSNRLSTIDVSKNSILRSLNIEYNQLTSLDVSKNTVLANLYCYNNQLTTLDVSKNTALSSLQCNNNQLTTLDVSKNTALTGLYCYNNQLTTLDVSKNTRLQGLECGSNKLTSLDVSANTKLTYFRCQGNPGSDGKFRVKAWFENSAIPANFTTGDWWIDGNTVAIHYYISEGLHLTVDKPVVKADGKDEARFTVTDNGVDVTSQVQVCMPSGMCLLSNVFTTREAGSYEFYASYASDPNNKSNMVTITAVAPSDGTGFDPTRTLRRNVAYFTLTATWCGPCYNFKETAMKPFLQQHPDDVIAVNIYTDNGEPQVNSNPSRFRDFERQLAGKGFQTGMVPNTIANLDSQIGGSLENTYNEYKKTPAVTAIRAESSVSGGRVNVSVSVGSKAAGEYRTGVFLIEDDIVCYQNGGGDRYNHTGVLRASASSDIFGASIGTLKVGEVTSKTYSFSGLSGYKSQNLSVVIYTLRNVGGNWVIDNSVKVPANGTVDFSYD